MSNKVSRTRSLIRTVCRDPSSPEVEEILEQIKESGRNPEVSMGLTIDDIRLLILTFVMEKATHKALVETFTIIANALVLNQSLLMQLNPHLISSKVLNECFQPDLEPKEEYLLFRLMFLLTYKGVEYDDKALKTCLTLIATRISGVSNAKCKFKDDGFDRLTFIECMKLTFNLLHHYPVLSIQHIHGITAQALLKIYYTIDPTDKINCDLCQYVSNVLLCIPVSLWLYEAEDAPAVLKQILSFTEVMVNPNNSPEYREDRILAPALSLVHCIVSDLHGSKSKHEKEKEEAVEETSTQQKHHLPHIHRHRRSSSVPEIPKLGKEKYKEMVATLREQILPSAKDREKPLGESDSLSSYLLNITIDPVLRTSRNIIFDIFWKVSDESPDEFVANFGLGFASSFLASHGIAFPESVSTESPTSVQLQERLREVKNMPINPITGQYLDFETGPSPEEEMTEEEKLRDAERLFVLFERLKANNMIKVENPVEVAARNGELDKY